SRPAQTSRGISVRHNIPKRTPLAERLSFFGSDPADVVGELGMAPLGSFARMYSKRRGTLVVAIKQMD
ncbi:hypothetical protein ACC764_39360, partial [Rhizobium ruizarguesonis]